MAVFLVNSRRRVTSLMKDLDIVHQVASHFTKSQQS